MAGLKSILFFLVAVSVPQCDAKMFQQGGNVTTAADVAESVATAVSGGISIERLEHYEVTLRSMFTTLPTNSAGRLEHQAVRYALHRLFMVQHGWFIKGLEDVADTFNGVSDPKTISRESLVPAMLQDQLEKRLGSHGLDLHELASLAAVLEDLIHKEAGRQLADVYSVLKLPTDTPINAQGANRALETYMMIFLIARNVSLDDKAQATQKFGRFVQRYRGWDVARDWLTRIQGHHFPDGISEKGVDFASMTRLVGDIGAEYSVFNDGECKDLKRTLTSMEVPGGKAARVRLADFYNASRHSHWKFTEKVEYLRALGALDESNPQQPLLIMPNYLMSRPNCLEATNLYAVCCRNECEDLSTVLEKEIAAPVASPDRIIELVTTFSSDTVHGPRELSEALVGRLREVASTHGGKVQLHSRLFAQWMHHAFPRECPYPHEAGQINPQTAEEWMKATGQSSVKASEQEMQVIIVGAVGVGSQQDGGISGIGEHDVDDELPWTPVDEVLDEVFSGQADPSTLTFEVLTLMIIATWVMFVLWFFAYRRSGPELKKSLNAVFVVCLVSVGAFAFGFLDVVTFASEVVILLVVVAAKSFMPYGKANSEKSVV